jgi:hypothetical protein
MNHNVPPIPTQLVVSAAVALAGSIAYVAALLIEEEQREVQESLLAQSLHCFEKAGRGEQEQLETVPERSHTSCGIGIGLVNASWRII